MLGILGIVLYRVLCSLFDNRDLDKNMMKMRAALSSTMRDRIRDAPIRAPDFFLST